MARTVLHIGAHKTATTYLQKKLAINRELLASRGVHYDPLDVFRKNFTFHLHELSRQATPYLEELRGLIGRQDVLLSDENIIGVPGDLVRSGVYYAHAHERVGEVCGLLKTDRPEIFMAMREYSTFIVSMYSEYIRHREFIDFPEYFELYKASNFSWIKVMDDIVSAAPNATIYLWDFANFRAAEPEVLSKMVGFDSAVMEAPEGPVRESFSEPAMRAFRALSEVLSHREMKKLIGPIARSLPKGEMHAAFSPMAPDLIETLKAQYKADFETIRTRFPKITVIG